MLIGTVLVDTVLVEEQAEVRLRGFALPLIGSEKQVHSIFNANCSDFISEVSSSP